MRELEPAWPPGRVRFEHQNIESFGCGVHRSRQPRRTGADDHQIAHVRLIDRLVETKTLGDLRIPRVTQDGLATANHGRHIRHRHLKPIEQFLRVRIPIEIDIETDGRFTSETPSPNVPAQS